MNQDFTKPGALLNGANPANVKALSGVFNNIDVGSNTPVSTQVQGLNALKGAGLTIPQNYNTPNPTPTTQVAGSTASVPPASPDVSQYLPLFTGSTGTLAQNGVTAPSSINPISFNPSPVNTVGSNLLSNASTSDATTAYNSALSNFQSGNSTATPTDQYMNQVYSQSQYTPQETAALQQYADVTNRINQTTLSERRQIQQLKEDGSLTTDQANSFSQESQRRSDQQLADLAVQQQGASLSLGVLGQIRGNNLQALQNISPFYNPQQIAPGSTLGNAQGQTFNQGNGASQQTILSSAMQLAQADQAAGTAQYNPDGSLNLQHYVQVAQSFYGGQSQGANAFAQGGQSQGGQVNPSYGAQGSQPQYSAQPGAVASPYQYALNAGLQPTVAGAVTQSPVTGDYYISGSKLPAGQENAANVQGGKTGISFVPAANVPNIQQLDTAIGQMQQLSQLAPQYLSSGLLGRIKGLTTNQLQSFLQTDPGWAKFNAVRLQAIDYLKGLAQGGGFRTTQSEIDTAANSILDISDNIESAQAKMDTAMKNINIAYKEYLPSHQDFNITLGTGAKSQSQSPSGSIYNF